MLQIDITMIDPAVSVIMPVLNGELFIYEAIKSVLSQTFKDFEVIVVDGRSVDNTCKVVKDFALEDSRIKLIVQIEPGLPAARNFGIQTSRGSYIAFLESDDLWYPDKLLLQVEEMEKNPEIGLVSCLSAAIDQNGKMTGWKLGVNENGNVYRAVIKRNPISSCSVPLIKRECLNKVGPFSENCKLSDDWEMWIRFAKRFPIKTIAKPLVGYRRCYSNRSQNYKEMIEDGELILKRTFENDPELSKDFYTFCLSRRASTIAGMCLIDRHYKEARKYLLYSILRSKLALFIDMRMFGIAFLIVLATVSPKFIFERILLKVFLPLIFKIKPGIRFIDI